MPNPETAYLIKKRQTLTTFRKAHAIMPEKAIIPVEYGVNTGMVFRRMVRDRILVKVDENKYYLDEVREYKLRHRASTLIIVALIVIVLTIFIVFAISATHNKF